MSLPVVDAHDPPRLPDSVELETPANALSFATAAADRPLRLDGRHVSVVGHERRGIESIRFARARVGSLTVDQGTAANCLITPRHVTRELVGPSGSSLERTFVPDTLPLVAFQWRPGVPGVAGPASLELGSEHPWSGVEAGAGWARVTASDGAALTVGFAGGRGRIEVTAGNAGHALLLTPTEPGTATLFLGGGDRGRALRGAAHISSHLLNASRGERDGFQLKSGVAEIDDAFAWARIRLRGDAMRLARDPSRDGRSSQALLTLVAALGVSDVDAAAAALGAGLTGAELGWGRRRYVETFHRDVPATPGGDAGGEARTGGRTLPMAGASAPSRAEWMEKLGAGTALPTLPGGLSPEEQSFFGLLATLQHDPDAGWTQWRTLVAEGMSGAHGFGLWDPATPAHLGNLRAASVLAGVAIGLLGLSADAEVDRLRIAPAFPASISSFAVAGIGMGASATDLAYARSDGTHRYELVPVHGRIPPTIVFEPTVRGRVGEVRLDGAPAELDLRSDGDGTTVPLQMRLEGPRTLEITPG